MPRRPTKRRAASSRDLLARYAAKRDFAQTPEPGAKLGRKSGDSYLIQKHEATRLHYDFRLELDGVLKSWAVTKGPSLDPADKRLAVHVEDHPLAYGGFEGVIPQGQYGGGTVMLWDRGSWEPVGDAHKGYAAGKLKFILHGDRLKGGWTLVRMGGRAAQEGRDNWLLIKEKDKYAKSGKGDALRDRSKTSVVTGKTMEQIAGARNPKVWQSKPRDKASDKSAAPKIVKSAHGAAAVKAIAVKGGRRAPLPDFVPPQLATLVDAPPQGGDWLHEIKIDGYRAYARREKGRVRFLTRTAQDWTDRFRSLVPVLEAVPGGDFALDGEIAVFDEHGASSFGALQAALSAGDSKRLGYIVFDLLYLDGVDLRSAALVDRKAALEKLLAKASKTGSLRYSDHLRAPGGTVFQHACKLALEGIVSKRADRPHVDGRTTDWVKSKCVARQEFVICGYTPPKKTGRKGFGSLIIGYYEEETLRYAGHVGTGFNDRLLRDLAARLEKLKTDKPSIPGKLPAIARRAALWVRPELVCEVEFTSWTSDGVLRHPSFQGLREDKPARSIIRDKAVSMPRKRAAAAATSRSGLRSKPVKSGAKSGAHEVAGVTISHPDREIFPDIGITKEGLAEYYRNVADWILPEIENRPLSLLRCPVGAGQQCFFQKHFPSGMKDLDRVSIKEKSGTDEYLVVHDTHQLVALIQEGIIEIHPWGARADDPDKPDRMIFDFDPASDVKFDAVIDTALAMHDLLAKLDLESWPKTTGGKGLHVVVPLKRGPGWKTVKAASRALADTFVAADPKRYINTASKSARAGKIFIDYLRNDRGSTAVAGYAVRARPGAHVAMPLTWNEVKHGLDPARFTALTVPDLLKKRKDPWAALYRNRQALSAKALKALGVD